jgi:hypothetical protein
VCAAHDRELEPRCAGVFDEAAYPGGAEVFRVDRHGPQLVYRRTTSAEEDAALSRAAQLTVDRLAVRGLAARIVSERLNRRMINLIPEPGWEDPPKVRIDELLAAVEARLATVGINGLWVGSRSRAAPRPMPVWPTRG